MSTLWRNKINRTILISSVSIVLLLVVIAVLAVFPFDEKDIAGLNWLANPWVWVVLLGILFWFIYFNLLLLIGSIREKMNALPGWTEMIISMVITLLPPVFIGSLANYDATLLPEENPPTLLLHWLIFIIALIGVIIITLWFLMSSTPKEEAVKA